MALTWQKESLRCQYTGYVGLFGFFLGVYLLNVVGPLWEYERAVEAFLFLLLPTWTFMSLAAAAFRLLDARSVSLSVSKRQCDTQRTQKSGVEVGLDRSLGSILGRALVKSVGFSASVCALALCYWTLEYYHAAFMSGVFGVRVPSFAAEHREDQVPYLHNFFRLFGILFEKAHLLMLYLILFVYLFLVDRSMSDPLDDGNWHTGLWVLQNLPFGNSGYTADTRAIVQHGLAWLVRGFWAPLMFTYLCENAPLLHLPRDLFHNDDFMRFFHFVTNLTFSVDVCFAALGYMLALRPLDSHVRSTEPTAGGWACTVICYEPFFTLLTSRYLDYARNPPWSTWLAATPLLLRVWGSAILFLQIVFAWCTVGYGLRYSNLSYRGVVLCTGPYWFCKHPAYVSKLAAFALISVPWVDLRGSEGAGRQIRNILTWMSMAGIYCARAWTEERHLTHASGTVYTSYAKTMPERHRQWFGRA
eukprot:gb/GEZN01006434.1/.p1 GENE.gb/GEZN01006434.1/~~gb/GEZN01006434.1/.p1  ORF type:complete len:514 (-),score=33.54 gb/GEZN01006434.1/:124-1542(-)